MLLKEIIDYLENNTVKVLPEFREKYFKQLKELGFNEKLNSSFIEFMVNYSDEYYGSEGLLNDVMQNDLSDFENGISKHFIDNYAVSEKYVSLFNLEVDDYLFYNKENDSVKLIQAENIKELSNDDYYDKKWNSFNAFLMDFFELD